MSSVRAAGLGVLAIALMSTAAHADMGLRGSLDADYNNMNGDNDVDGNLWNVNGHLLVPLGDGAFNLQGGAGYHNLDSDVNLGGDAWDVNGAAFWRGANGDIGVAVAHGNFSPDDNTFDDFDVTAIGAFGEWFAGERVTVSAQGGWLTGDTDGDYYGGGLKFYIMPNLSIAGNVDRVHFEDLGHVTTWGLTGEWQPFGETPLSIYGGYANSDFSGADFNVDTWRVGLRWRFGEQGTTLVQGDRTNVVPNTTVNFGSAFSF